MRAITHKLSDWVLLRWNRWVRLLLRLVAFRVRDIETTTELLVNIVDVKVELERHGVQ